MPPPKKVSLLIICLIILVALLIRIWGIDFGLPYLYHPDEPNKIMMAQRMFKTGDLNPHYFQKPTLFIYLNALAYIPYYILGKIVGIFNHPNDILQPQMIALGVGKSSMPATILMGRSLTAIFATASVFLVYLIGRKINDKIYVGFLAALMMAISPTNVLNSRYITANSYLVFFILIVTWSSLRIYQQGKTIDYIVSGIAVGLAISSKYPGAIVGIIPLTAHFLQPMGKKLKDFRLYLYLILIPVAFFVTSPFAILDYKKFLDDTMFEANHYSSGHGGMEGNSLVWYLNYMWQTAGIIYILATLEIVRGIYLRNKEIIILAIFPLVYFVFICTFVVRNARTLLPLTPFIFLLSSSLIVYLFSKINGLQIKPVRQVFIIALICLLSVSLITPISQTITRTINLATKNSRETASFWIDENLPSSSHIALESYSPYVDPGRFSVHGIVRVIDNDPDWYINNDFEYLIFSENMFGRFYDDPEKYSVEISQYDSFFNRFPLEKKFVDGGYVVLIYKVE